MTENEKLKQALREVLRKIDSGGLSNSQMLELARKALKSGEKQ